MGDRDSVSDLTADREGAKARPATILQAVRSPLPPLLAALLALAAAAPAGAATRVLLTDVGADDGLDPATASTLNRVFEGEVRRTVPDVELVTFRAVRTNLEVAEMADCLGDEEAAACATELGNALGVDLVATPRLGRLGSVRVLTLSVYRLGDATVAGQSTRRTEGNDAALLDEVRPLVEEAFSTTGLRVVRAAPAEVAQKEEASEPTIWPWVLGGAGVGLGALAVGGGLLVHGGSWLTLQLPYEAGLANRDVARIWESSAVFFVATGWALYAIGGVAAATGVALGLVVE